MGDINDSKEFPVLFRPFVVAQVSQLNILGHVWNKQVLTHPSIYRLTKVRIITELVNSLLLLRSFLIHHPYSFLWISSSTSCFPT